MSNPSATAVSRRDFVKTAAVGAAATFAAPAIVTAKKTDGPVIVGEGEYRYQVHSNWAKLPDEFTWQTTHNVAVDSEGLLYVIHEGRFNQKDHPSIFVFDQQGAYVRSFGSEFQGGGHGIEVRNESGQDFLYVCAYQQQRSFAKLDTKGELVWRNGAPMESGRYAEGEDQFPRQDSPWGRDRFMPTNIAFLPDGEFLLADGYGAFCIHRYNAQGEWVGAFGKPASQENGWGGGKFNLPHGIWIDSRGEEPLVVIADRALNRMQWLTIDGEHRHTMEGFLLPANVDSYGDLLVIPELVGRTTLLGKDNEVVARLGDDSERIKADKDRQIRATESMWQDGRFIHPHDACFDADGNLFVAEWVRRGRVTKLERLV